jgi:succinate-semialdehyde dehydrogenase/glutarate-semialdehyde dehydrogenase
MPVSHSTFYTINPFSEENIAEYRFDSDSTLEEKLQKSHQNFQLNKNASIENKVEWLNSLIPILESSKNEWARCASLEMGKPLLEAMHEIEKCIGLCHFFIENTSSFLSQESIPYTKKAVITKSPVGVVLGVMPWNYPFWQVFRFAIPALMAGNSVVLKHAPNVTGCALFIQDAFSQSLFPQDLFQVALANNEQTLRLISDERVQRISFTGSNETGFKIAQAAGTVGKRCVLELGGSDPFIVMPDAPLEKVIPQAIKSRFINAGQSCISAKRFIVHSSIQEVFTQKLIQAVQELQMGNPLESRNQVGPLARKDLQIKVLSQIESAKAFGSQILFQSNTPSKGFFVPLTVFGNVHLNSSIWKEEVFGPVALVKSFDNDEEMLNLANDTVFGLGASIWSKNLENAFTLAQRIDAGNVYVNEMMKSDFSLPFGGTKQSGFGKELSKTGMMEFMNLKTSIISPL